MLFNLREHLIGHQRRRAVRAHTARVGADIAFVAASLLPALNAPYDIPLDGRHPPIRQDAAFLNAADGNEAAEAFWQYLFSDDARPRIRAGGYDLP